MKAFSDIDIGELLPQGAAFRLCDTLLHYDDDETRTAYTVADGGPFTTADGRMRAAGLVEVMAQCSAARIGYICRYILHKPVSIGYIGSVSALKVAREPRVGEVLLTRLQVVAQLGDLTAVSATVTSGDEVIASASLGVALDHDTPA